MNAEQVKQAAAALRGTTDTDTDAKPAPADADWNIVLIRRVAEQLMAHDPDSFGRLDVTAVGTQVVLRGVLTGVEARDRALEIARGTQGAGAVIDRITVRAKPAARATVEEVTLTSAPVREPWWQRATVPAALVAVLAAIGASQWKAATAERPPAPQPVIPVDGFATIDGRPAAGAKLTFHPVNAVGGVKERPTAVVGSDGRYVLGTYAEADGAPAGPYVVTVEYRPPASGSGADETAASSPDLAPPAFRSRFTSPLRALVPGDAKFVRLPPLHVTAPRAPKVGEGNRSSGGGEPRGVRTASSPSSRRG